jgi:hypothetical protein
MTKKRRRMIETGALLATILLAGYAPLMAAKITQDPLQGDGGVSPFYLWTDDIPEVPGKMLREEALPNSLVLANASEGRRILYTSTDGIDGKSPVTGSGAVFFPKGSAPSRGWPVIAWAHGTVGIADVCAPSWRGRSQRDIDYLNAWLAQGAGWCLAESAARLPGGAFRLRSQGPACTDSRSQWRPFRRRIRTGPNSRPSCQPRRGQAAGKQDLRVGPGWPVKVARRHRQDSPANSGKLWRASGRGLHTLEGSVRGYCEHARRTA